MKRFFFALLALLGLCVVSLLSGTVGYLLGLTHEANRVGADHIRITEELIAAHPSDYHDLSINRGPMGKFLVQGTVSDAAIRDEFLTQLREAIGEHYVERVDVIEIHAQASTE